MSSIGEIPYTRDELLSPGPQRTFTGRQLSEIAFPLGGIGTGTISLGGRGNLRDFEIFNKPNKGHVIPYTFFAIWVKAKGRPPAAKILEGKVPPPYRRGFGEPQAELQGVARFAEAAFRGEYPTAILELSDPDIPIRAKLTAWNPFIPLNVKDSALPVAVFEWTFTNPTNAQVEISLAASMSNPLIKIDEEGRRTGRGSTNAYQKTDGLQGTFMLHPEADPKSPNAGTLSLTTTWDDLDVQTRWYRGGWSDKCHLFWDDFSDDGRLSPVLDADPAPRDGDVCSLALHAKVPAGGSVTLPVYVTWHFPVIANPWPAPEGGPETLDTYAGVHFDNAWSVADYVVKNLDRLRGETHDWQSAVFGSTLPSHVLEAITSQASIMRTCTCFLLADGSFFGWEGCGDQSGCCRGNCTHVWNYEQAVAFLFPELERSMRRTEFAYNIRDTGYMGFRTYLPPGSSISDYKPCADGQMGAIIQVYRDWQLSGDDALLKEIWPKVKPALEYAWTITPDAKSKYDSLWDPDKDGVMEGEQHNTYDIEFFGPNTLCTAMYLGALRACEEIALHLGETQKAEEYRAIYESGRAKVEAELWNGEYYIQKVKVIDGITIPDTLKSPTRDCNMPKYQYGDGCLSDQLLGQWAAQIAGLGYLLDPQHVKTALKSIFTHNFRSPIGSFSNVQRVYALNDEAGLLLCTWPRGNRPTLPFVYCDEVWTGIEFQVAAHLIYEGLIEEGLAVVKAVTERYAGYNRNPWNEVECGHHYARAMSSWSVKLALDGFIFSLVRHGGRLGFAPKVYGDNYRTFWSTGTGWGLYEQRPGEGKFRLEVLHGRQTLKRLDLADLTGDRLTVTGPKGAIKARVEGKSVIFGEPITLAAGEALEISSA